VPPLPKLSDPELFIRIHDSLRSDLPRQAPDSLLYSHFKKFIRPQFAQLAKRGDALLEVKCQEIIYEIFGTSNGKLVNLILDETTSNDTWRHFAIAYHLDRYVAAEQRNKQTDKFWADIWEAYWGALFLERQLWNEDDTDLVRCLRVLVHLRHDVLIREFGMVPYFRSDLVQNFPQFISQTDIDTVLVKDHPALKIPPDFIERKDFFGYRATIKSSSNHYRDYRDVRVFSEVEDDAISDLILYCSVPWSILPSYIQSDLFRRKSPLARNPNLKCLLTNTRVNRSRKYLRYPRKDVRTTDLLFEV